MAIKFMENRLAKYLLEAKEELKKVTWPTKKDTTKYSLAILVFCLALAAYFSVLDWLLNMGVQYLLSLVA
ncbi:MAG: preprotein translocase subunit SecE [Patescibacteria group bacterium]|jgi:preprotein translocase subunit SecE